MSCAAPASPRSCDEDDDNDSWRDQQDRCPLLFSGRVQERDSDFDGVGDVCDDCPSAFNPQQRCGGGFVGMEKCQAVSD